MKYEIIDKENLESTIKITIEPSDYAKEYNKQVKEVQAKGNFKGFRKGKVPASFVNKMYGKNFISEAVSKAIDKAFKDIVDQEKLVYVAQPLPSNDEMLDPDHKDLNKEYVYHLDIGRIEPFEVGGIDGTFEKYVVETDQATVDAHLKNISETFGTMESVDDAIEADDVLKVSAIELDGVDAKKDGWMASFDIVMKSVKSEELKEELLKKQKGDKFVANINVVTNRPSSSIRKDLLGVEEDDDREIGEMFEFTIEDVERLKPAELTDELIKEKLTTWNLSTVEELIEDFKTNQAKGYEKDALAILRRDVMDSMMDNTTVNMSESFIERWLKESEKVDDDKLASQAKGLTQEIKWSSVKRILLDKYDVQISKADIDAKLRERAMQFMRQYGMFDESLLGNLVERLRGDQNEMYNAMSTVEAEKMFDAMMPDLKIAEKSIGSEAFNEMIEERFGAQAQPADEEE